MFGGGFFGAGGGGFGGGVPSRFDNQYQVFPVSFIGKEDLEKGNKMILPASALDQLARMNIQYPMLFELSNSGVSRKTHAGVQEFIAEEGTCYLPYWMMLNLFLKEGDMVKVCNTSLPKGSFVKLQPVSSDFLDIHNPRAVLENALRNFATLTVGDCIVLDYNQKRYEIEIIECKPGNAVSIIEADVNVDFAPPKDYREPERPVNTPATSNSLNVVDEPEEPEPMAEDKGLRVFGGEGKRVDGKAIKTPLSPAAGPAVPPADEENEMPWEKRIPGGVKYTETNKPYGYGEGHMTGKQSGGSSSATPAVDLDLFGGGGKTLQ